MKTITSQGKSKYRTTEGDDKNVESYLDDSIFDLEANYDSK